ncbi:MAG: hypothetical protein ACO1G9_12795 [Bacteroidota bacterium]
MSLSSCSVIEPAAPSPTYLQIDSFRLTSDFAVSGSNSSKITDIWVIVDGVYLGTFPLPCKIPVAEGGTHSFTIRAGIVENGISSIRSAYTKYTSFDTTMNMEVGKTYSVLPKIGYNSFNNYPNKEDFEDASLDLVSTSSGNTPLTIITAPDPDIFEGNSGKATLADTNTVLEIASVNPFTLPINTTTYIELNYKSDVDFTIGTFITTTSVFRQELLNIRASGEWKKIYINVNDLGGIASNATSYKFFIRAEKPSTMTTANLFFDNFKVIY